MVEITRVEVLEEPQRVRCTRQFHTIIDLIGGAFTVSSAKAEIPVAQSVPLADLVSYQDGSIVSRVLVGREAGTITLFAFDEEQALSEHTAPFDALDVEAQEVVPIQAGARSGCVQFKAGMRAMEVVVVEPAIEVTKPLL